MSIASVAGALNAVDGGAPKLKLNPLFAGAGAGAGEKVELENGLLPKPPGAGWDAPGKLLDVEPAGLVRPFKGLSFLLAICAAVARWGFSSANT